MRRRQFLHTGVALTSPLLAGCSFGGDCKDTPLVTAPGPDNAGTIDPDRIVQLSSLPCLAVAGTTFVTVRKHPTLGPDSRYHAKFSTQEVHWVTGDQVTIQQYYCHSNGCQAVIQTGLGHGTGPSFRWVYDTRTGVLKKGDKRYRPISK